MYEIENFSEFNDFSSPEVNFEINEGKLINDSFSLSSSFSWKVAFKLESLANKSGYKSRRFCIMPLTDLEFWLSILKESSTTFSIYFYKNFKGIKYLAPKHHESHRVKVRIFIKGYIDIPEERIMDENTNCVLVRLEKENFPDKLFETRQWWTIKCKLQIFDFDLLKPQYLESRFLNGEEEINNFREPLWGNFENLLKTGQFSDITLVTADSIFKLHKCMLINRTKLLDSIDNEVINCPKLKDIPKPVMDEVLRYIYTAEMNELKEDSCLNIYKTANIFGLSVLSETLSRTISKQFDVHTILNVVKASNTYQDDDLFITAVKFAAENFEEVRKTSEWEKFKIYEILARRIENTFNHFSIIKSDRYKSINNSFVHPNVNVELTV